MFPVAPIPIDCTHSDVDQIQIYVEASALPMIVNVQFDGVDVDFFKDSDAYRSWISIINLHWTDTSAAAVVSGSRGRGGGALTRTGPTLRQRLW